MRIFRALNGKFYRRNLTKKNDLLPRSFALVLPTVLPSSISSPRLQPTLHWRQVCSFDLRPAYLCPNTNWLLIFIILYGNEKLMGQIKSFNNPYIQTPLLVL